MIPWGTTWPPLLALVKTLSGLDQCAKLNKKRPMIATSQQAIGLLSINGTEELVQKAETFFRPVDPDNPDTCKLLQTQRTLQRVTIRVKVESMFAADGKIAENYLERLRGRWSWWSTTQALRAFGFGFSEMGATTPADLERDSHMVSVAIADCRFIVGSSDTDPTEYDQISSIELIPALVS